MDCLFCKIVKGEIPAAKIYEDENVLAFLDVNPDSKGHTLVIPKQHAQDIFDIEKESLQKVFIAAKIIAQKLKDSLRADGINLMQANGKAANQVVMHFHLHLIPRYQNDSLIIHGHRPKEDEKPSFAKLQDIAKKIK